MIKHFLKDIGIYGFSGIIVRIITFLLIPLYVRVLDTEQLGVIDLIMVISSIAGVVLSLEIYQFIARFFSEYDEKQKQIFASTGLVFYVCTYLLFTAIIFTFSGPVSYYIFNAAGYESVLKLATISIFVTSIFNYFQNLLRYTLKSVSYSIANIVFTITTAGFSIYLVLFQKLGLQGVYFGQIIGGIMGLIISAFYNIKYISLTFCPRSLYKMLAFSLPLVLSGLSLYAITYIDRIFIKHFLTMSDLGIYGVAFRISAIPLIFLGFVTSSFVPIMYSKYTENETKSELEKIYRYTFFIGFAIITFINIFSFEIFAIITTPEYENAYKVAPFLLFSGFVMQFATMFLGLSLEGKTKIISYIYLLGFIISIILNILLIPHFGIIGAGMANSIVAIIIFCFQFYFSQKSYRIYFKYTPYILILIVSLTFSVFAFTINTQVLYMNYIIKTVILILFLLTFKYIFTKFSFEK